MMKHRHAAPCDAAGSPQPQSMQHTIFLTGLFTETLAWDKIAMWAGIGAYLSCGFCLFQIARYTIVH